MYSFHINLALVNQPLKYNQPGDPNSELRTDNSSHLEQAPLYKQTHTHKQDKEQQPPPPLNDTHS